MELIDIFGSLMVLVFMVGLWTLICNQRTYRQRLRIIDWVYDGSGNWQARSRAYDEVTYDQHLWALVTFSDPKKLYNFKD
jgi:hypothetical protein